MARKSSNLLTMKSPPRPLKKCRPNSKREFLAIWMKSGQQTSSNGCHRTKRLMCLEICRKRKRKNCSDSWRLQGVIALRSLILADPASPLAEVMRTEFQSADADDTASEVAQKIAEYNLLALPVVDEGGDILGIITVDDAMEILLPKDWRQRLPKLFG